MTNSQLSPQEAARELLARRKARTTIEGLVDYLDTGFKPARHHKLLNAKLEAVERGEIKRLMVMMPPGSAKSTYSSIYFPSYYLGKQPEKSVIAASHTAELAERFGRRVRNVVGSKEFHNVYGIGLSDDSQAAGRWDTSKGGEYYAVGVGGSVTGRRADLGVIDDPIKSREQADSQRERDKVWEWYKADFYTRLKPGAAIVLVMTRWHEDDLAGRLLNEMNNGGEQWEILALPMEAEEGDQLGRKPGEMLWAEWFTPEMLAFAKRDPRNWSALYQQRPAPEDGDFFKREWFRFYDDKPQHLHVYGASDYAVTSKGGDYTVHLVAGVDPDDNIYLLDLWRGQESPDIWVDAFLDLANRHKPLKWAEEQGQIVKSLDPFIRQRMQERQIYFAREQFTSTSDKATRAQSIRGRMSMGKVYFPKHAPWLAEFMRELLTFPVGVHDDQVDPLGLIGRMLDQMVGASLPVHEGPKRDRYSRLFNFSDEDDSWKTA